jgi:hypothetical protein
MSKSVKKIEETGQVAEVCDVFYFHADLQFQQMLLRLAVHVRCSMTLVFRN